MYRQLFQVLCYAAMKKIKMLSTLTELTVQETGEKINQKAKKKIIEIAKFEICYERNGQGGVIENNLGGYPFDRVILGGL